MASLKLHGAKNLHSQHSEETRGVQAVREKSTRGQRLETPRDFSASAPTVRPYKSLGLQKRLSNVMAAFYLSGHSSFLSSPFVRRHPR